jgi:hypothetical protein
LSHSSTPTVISKSIGKQRNTLQSIETSLTSSTSSGTSIVSSTNGNNTLNRNLDDLVDAEDEEAKNHYINAYLENISDVYYENNNNNSLNSFNIESVEELNSFKGSNHNISEPKFKMRFFFLLSISLNLLFYCNIFNAY